MEVKADQPLLDNFDVVSHDENGGSSICSINVTYPWKPPTCSFYHVFGHSLARCSRTPAKSSGSSQSVGIPLSEPEKSSVSSQNVGVLPSKNGMGVTFQENQGWRQVRRRGKVTRSNDISLQEELHLQKGLSLTTGDLSFTSSEVHSNPSTSVSHTNLGIILSNVSAHLQTPCILCGSTD